jgi:hypothetical protein
LGALRRHLAIKGIKSLRVTNTIEVVEGEGEVHLLESSGSLKVELESSIKNKDSRHGSSRERKRSSRFGSQRKILFFLSSQQP